MFYITLKIIKINRKSAIVDKVDNLVENRPYIFPKIAFASLIYASAERFMTAFAFAVEEAPPHAARRPLTPNILLRPRGIYSDLQNSKLADEPRICKRKAPHCPYGENDETSQACRDRQSRSRPALSHNVNNPERSTPPRHRSRSRPAISHSVNKRKAKKYGALRAANSKSQTSRTCTNLL